MLIAALIYMGIDMLHHDYTCQKASIRYINLPLLSQALRDLQDGQKLDKIDLEVQSDRKSVYVSINGIKIYEVDEVNDRSRGLHVIILNEYTGTLIASTVYDFYGGDSSYDLRRFLNIVSHSRITIFLIKDEASTGFSKAGRSAIESFGCKLVYDIAFRDNWVCITRPRVRLITESIVKKPRGSDWANPAKVRISSKVETAQDTGDQHHYVDSDQRYKRKLLCKEYKGYENACNFSVQLYKGPPKLMNNNVAHVPVVIIASNRPRYLFRMLYKLVHVAGAERRMMTVFVDGFYNETRAVAEIFGLRVVFNQMQGENTWRLQQHYRISLSKVFDDFPLADAAIIMEEDLEVSDDFFDYFSQTYPLLMNDSSIYCISAWNEQGFQHSVHDPSLLYRVGFMPGLGWMLTRSLYKNELEPNWPSNRSYLPWDLYMRQNHIMKGRECIIPDIPRTYRFGKYGLTMDRDKQKRLFEFRPLNKEPGQKFDIEKLKKNNYEKELERLIR